MAKLSAHLTPARITDQDALMLKAAAKSQEVSCSEVLRTLIRSLDVPLDQRTEKTAS